MCMKGSMDDKYYKIYLKTMVSYEINQLLKIYVLIFTMVSFVSFAFISALIFKISFLLLTLGFSISSFSSCFRCKSQVIYLTFFLFLEVCLYCCELSSQHCFYSVPQVLGCFVFIFILFYAIFDFFFDFFFDLLVIQKRVVQPPYVEIFNSFSPVIEI